MNTLATIERIKVYIYYCMITAIKLVNNKRRSIAIGACVIVRIFSTIIDLRTTFKKIKAKNTLFYNTVLIHVPI